MVFERATATATRLIQKYGQDCTWRKIAPGPGGTAAKPASTVPTDAPCRIVFLNHKRESLASALSMLVGTNVPSGGMLGLMSAVGFEPELKDLVIRAPVGQDGEQFGIDDDNGIEMLKPNGEGAILYKIRLVR